jgi:hypothetical protein
MIIDGFRHLVKARFPEGSNKINGSFCLILGRYLALFARGLWLTFHFISASIHILYGFKVVQWIYFHFLNK